MIKDWEASKTSQRWLSAPEPSAYTAPFSNANSSSHFHGWCVSGYIIGKQWTQRKQLLLKTMQYPLPGGEKKKNNKQNTEACIQNQAHILQSQSPAYVPGSPHSVWYNKLPRDGASTAWAHMVKLVSIKFSAYFHVTQCPFDCRCGISSARLFNNQSSRSLARSCTCARLRGPRLCITIPTAPADHSVSSGAHLINSSDWCHNSTKREPQSSSMDPSELIRGISCFFLFLQFDNSSHPPPLRFQNRWLAEGHYQRQNQ